MYPKVARSDPSGVTAYYKQGEDSIRLTPPVRLVPIAAAMCPFSGTDNESPTREFIIICEDVKYKGHS